MLPYDSHVVLITMLGNIDICNVVLITMLADYNLQQVQLFDNIVSITMLDI